jgi:hypothetical protein
MSLFAALDSYTNSTENVVLGENGHVQLDWANGFEDRIVQFDFQCVRTDSHGISRLGIVLDDMLKELSVCRSNNVDEIKRKHLLTILFKLIAKTRDVNGGKGEYTLSYMMIFIWWHYFPRLAEAAVSLFLLSPALIDNVYDDQEPYGSWKDVKYLCKFIFDKTHCSVDHPLIQFCIKRMNESLRDDIAIYESTVSNKKMTLVSKWVAREGSKKFGFLFDALATNYFPQYIASADYVPMAHRALTKKKALDKCRAQYRMLCSKLNRHIDTVQIKQCGKNWADINHAKTTSITMAKQRNAFLNVKGKNQEQRTMDSDRVQCADNLRTHLENLKKVGKEVKGKHVALNDFTKEAEELMALDHRGSYPRYIIPKSEIAGILNSQWRDNSNKKNANGLGPIVAMADLSGSMSGNPLYAAIALSCRVAEKSCLGRRVMTFSANPSWINLDDHLEFTDMVVEIHRNSRTAGLNTDFYKALDLILTAIEQRRVPPADVENMILAIFSDMQIDDNLCYGSGNGYDHTEQQAVAARGKWATMHEQIKQKYADVGMRLYGEPLKAPHILFWNLRRTDGFPALSTQAGCSMMSGFDPTILNMFCEMGIDALKDMSPYKNLIKQLDNPRYLPMEHIAQTVI